MEPALHMLSPRAAEERLAVRPRGRTMARAASRRATAVVTGALIRHIVAARRARLARLARSFADTSIGMAVVGGDSHWVEVNGALCRLLGRSRDELVGHATSEVAHPEDLERARAPLHGGPRTQTWLQRCVRPDAEVVWASVESLRFKRTHGEPYFFYFVSDVTAQQRARESLHRQARENAAVARLGRLALDEQDINAVLDEVVAVVAETLEIGHAVLLELEPAGRALRVVAAVGAREGVLHQMRVPAIPGSLLDAALGHQEPLIVEDVGKDQRFRDHPLLREYMVGSGMSIAVRTRRGAWGLVAVYSETRRVFRQDEAGFLRAVANVVSGAVERREVEEQIRHRALHDALTGLPNRTLVLDRLGGALARRQRDGGMVAVLLLDLDQFKVVNDSLGHQAGDDLLTTLAPRLRDALRPADSVGRLGGDEFVVICEDLEAPHAAIQVAQRVLAAVSQPLVVRDDEHFVTASLGIAIAESADVDAESLVRDADAAMYRAKDRGRGRYELFDDTLRQRVLVRLRTESELRRALERDELVVYYQPMIDLEEGRIAAVEAVVRWQHPRRGLLEPVDFIGVAEDTGLILPLGDAVLTKACRDVAELQRRSHHGPRPLTLSVNASAKQLADSAFPTRVAEIARRCELAPGSLTLEITESMLMEEAHSPATVLSRMRELGIGLLLDDFGTGYSGLSYLRRFPLDGLKIDRAFVAGLGTDEEDSVIVAAVIRMARTLGLTVIAEGVETHQQLAGLLELECDRAQGFLYSPPIPADQLGPMMAATPSALPRIPPA